MLAGTASAQSALDGTWEMTSYEGPASVGKGSGLLTFSTGRFSLVYTMDEPDGATSGRAHAGRFSRSGDSIGLDVDWTMEYVKGKGQARRGGGQRTVKIATANDALTLTFENGSVQRFRRVAAK
jgi:hypothetical protein